MSSVTLHEGDNRESLRRLIEEGVRVHSVVTDPPYGLVSIQKRFGKDDAKPARREKNDGSFARLSGGFMGKQWDATGIERDPEFWRLIYDILLPGGYVFAFSSSRTGHWQACAMELAGFIMHPMHGWCFGSGFPKAHAADKAIDKYLGVKGSYEGTKPGHEGFKGSSGSSVRSLKGTMGGEGGFARPWMDDPEAIDRYHSAYVPSSDEAAQWEGWAYGTQAQKPALEPIYLGQKPFSEKTGAANLLKHGVGAVNIDGCRVPADGRPLRVGDYKETANNTYDGRLDGSLMGGSKAVGTTDVGRHPANLLLDGSPEVIAMFPASAGASAPVRGTEPSGVTKDIYGKFNGRIPGTFFNDSGSAARFFHHFPLTDEDYELAKLAGTIGDDRGDPLIYNGKAAKADRGGSNHPTVKPIALMQNLVRHITPPGGIVLDPFAGTGTTAVAAQREGLNCILMEAEPEYAGFLRKRFDLDPPKSPSMFDDLLGDSTESTLGNLFEDLLT